jgi:hypothetical protein
VAKKAAPKDPDAALLAALEKILDGTARQLLGAANAGAIFGTKEGALAEAALSRGLIEEVSEPQPTRPTKKKTSPVRYARITETGRQWVMEKSSPLAIAEGLRDSLNAQSEALTDTVRATQTQLAEVASAIEQLSRALKEQAERHHQVARALLSLLEQGRKGSPPEADWLDEAVQIVAERKRQNSMTRPTLPQLYAELRKSHPTLSLTQFHDGLRTLHSQRRILLGAYTLALATIPDHLNALYLDKEVKFYVDLP